MTSPATSHDPTSPDPAPHGPAPHAPVPARGGRAALTVVPAPATASAVLPPRSPRLHLLHYEPDPDDPQAVPAAVPGGEPAPCPVLAADDPQETAAVHRRAQHVLRLALEVLDGRRPLPHLAPHLEPPVLRYVRAAHTQRPVLRHPSRLTSLHVSRPHPAAAEVAAVYRRGGRARALAARFEGRRSDGGTDDPGRWRCVTLRLL